MLQRLPVMSACDEYSDIRIDHHDKAKNSKQRNNNLRWTRNNRKIHWRLNQSWHHNTEQPDRNRLLDNTWSCHVTAVPQRFSNCQMPVFTDNCQVTNGWNKTQACKSFPDWTITSLGQKSSWVNLTVSLKMENTAHNKSVIDRLQSSRSEGCRRDFFRNTAVRTRRLNIIDREANRMSIGMTP